MMKELHPVVKMCMLTSAKEDNKHGLINLHLSLCGYTNYSDRSNFNSHKDCFLNLV